jgi:ankyrin repeat protein
MPTPQEIFDAIAAGDLARIQSLLDADPTAAAGRNAEGVSPLLFALYRGIGDVVKELLRRNAPMDIWEAAAAGEASIVATEIEMHPDAVHQRSPDGWLPLHLACFFGHPEAALLIVTHGADIDAVSGGFRVMPLQSALANSHEDIARMLIEHGASVEASPEGSDWSPLHYCAANDLPEIAALLLERGANPNSRIATGETALQMADKAGNTAITEILLSIRNNAIMPDQNPLDRLRTLCLNLPETTERLSHGEPTWFIRDKKTFVMYADRHHDDRIAFWCAAPMGAQAAMVSAEPTRFFSPPYVGCRGWIGVWLDIPVDWEEIEQIVTDAYRAVAPKRLSESLTK